MNHCSRTIFLLNLLLLGLGGAQAQRPASNWHFGQGVAISFAGGQPRLNPPSAMLTTEGCAALSDAQGQLLFYTNGGGRPDGSPDPGTIWNRNHRPPIQLGRNSGWRPERPPEQYYLASP
ncbi:MAG: hypothetical protein HC821_00500 [Lewinella sp.]|nr:hypothetical protein [Lewinella sp.]